MSMQEIKVNQILDLLGSDYSFSNDYNNFFFNNVKPVNESNDSSLSWLNPTRKDIFELLALSKAKIIICSDFSDLYTKYPEKLFIQVENPKLVFLRVVKEFFSKQQEYGIHSTAIISPMAKIHPESYIGPFCTIGDVQIGRNSVIQAHCSLGNKTTIGNNVMIKQG